ncbi:hypothetical protein [Kordiimonas aquimaris]|uniref:hypothetical protein n=1 Tax=Kordiimonas aquimaris TaxID=707591 RepID=UPI0021D24588|nr:hypothetical protein [Kordiimonas aquimaris]
MNKQLNTIFRRSLMQCVLLALTATASQAFQSGKAVPDDLLALDHQRCMNGCVPGFGEATCKPLCDCTVSEFKKQLDFEAYLDMSVQLSKNAVTPELRTLLDGVAKMCTAEIERKGIEVGTGEKLPEPSR